MSTKRTDELLDISRQAEEHYLDRTLEVIHNNVTNYSRDVARMRAEIDDMLDHFHDDNPELINTLENTMTLHDALYRALLRNERALDKPYFGRIIFHDETYDRDESLYIGKGGIARDATHPVVIDWRAPVANAYYDNGLGKCSYPSPDGGQVDIDLKLKRTYEIEDGRLLNLFDAEVISNDDLLTKYLAQNKQAVLGDIVATIQQEQNAIIRKSPYHNVIVQGVAGSGKTTVAMHRISYILYNYADRFRPDDFYIVGSNRILLNYITGVLPSLDVYGVRQMTMEQLFIRLLYEDWDEKKYCVGHLDQRSSRGSVKGSLEWFNSLREFCRRLEWSTIPRESVYLNPRQFVEGLRDGKPGVYDETGGVTPNPADLVLLMDGKAIERYIRQNPTVSIQSKINMLNERLHTKITDEFLGKGVKYTEPEKKAILKAYRNRYGAGIWKKSIFDLYQDFLAEQIAKGYDVDSATIGGTSQSALDVYDLAALAYLYKRVKETDEIQEASHVVIDEAQDFGMMAYSVLKFCIKNCTYTIMGDVSQNIHFGYGLNDWEELKNLYLPDSMDSFSTLKKSYRNTVEISNFATNILHHGQFSIYPVEPIIRHGKTPVVTQLADRSRLISQAAHICQDWQLRGLGTIAVICREQETATAAATELAKLIPLPENDPETMEFGNGILVLPVEYTKGLEFDAVLILDPTREEYPSDDGHAKLLYVAATRALHELCILHTGNLTGLIADPVPERVRQTDTLQGTVSKENAANRHPSESTGPASASHHSSEPFRKTKKPVILSTKTDKPAIHVKTVEPQSGTTRPIQTDYTGAGPRRAPEQFPASTLSREFPAATDAISFGDMPATEKLRIPGHSRIDPAVRWVSKQSDGLYLQSRYGLLRLSPITDSIIRITFTTGNRILDGVHPKIAVKSIHRAWMFRESPRQVELTTDELCLQVDKSTGSISYMTRDKKLLLAESSRECRLMQPSPSGDLRSWLSLDWQKSENLYGISAAERDPLKLKGTARYISHCTHSDELPFLLSDKGYGILLASDGPTMCCALPAYGSYIYSEYPEQMDYYFIAGKKSETILSAYGFLCGKSW